MPTRLTFHVQLHLTMLTGMMYALSLNSSQASALPESPSAFETLVYLQPTVSENNMARMDRRVVEGPPLVVTIPGRECQLTVANVGGMPAEEYRLLWTVCLYARIDSSSCTHQLHVVLTPQQVYTLYSSS